MMKWQRPISFEQEYALDLLLHNYAKPVLVWGRLCHGWRFRPVYGGSIPFGDAVFASGMPEINIGLYPDVGATRFLADRGAIGLFTGLTGSIMTAAVLTALAGQPYL